MRATPLRELNRHGSRYAYASMLVLMVLSCSRVSPSRSRRPPLKYVKETKPSKGLHQKAADLCYADASLGPRFKIAGTVRQSSHPDDSIYWYSIRLPGSAVPARTWLEGEIDPKCSGHRQCTSFDHSLVETPLAMKVCGPNGERVEHREALLLRRIYLLSKAMPLPREHRDAELQSMLQNCGVGPIGGYPRVGLHNRSHHEVKHHEKKSGVCLVEFEKVEPRREYAEPEHIFALSRFVIDGEFRQVTIMYVTSESDSDLARKTIQTSANSFEVDWSKFRNTR